MIKVDFEGIGATIDLCFKIEKETDRKDIIIVIKRLDYNRVIAETNVLSSLSNNSSDKVKEITKIAGYDIEIID